MEPIEVDRWEGRPVWEWRDRWGVPTLRVFRRMGSTSDLARELAEAGAETGTTVIADEQTRGRGRRGRPWHSPPASSVSFSMVLRPPGRSSSRLLTLRLGLAAAAAVEREVDLSIGLKWPNDLIIQDRKAGGILCESVIEDERIRFVIAGIGVNIRQRDDEWPPELAARAISLAAALERSAVASGADEPRTGKGNVAPQVTLDRASLTGAVIMDCLRVARAPADRLDASEMQDFARRDVLRGRMISVEGEPAGTAHGITDTGALRVIQDGREREIVAGTIREIEHQQGGSA